MRPRLLGRPLVKVGIVEIFFLTGSLASPLSSLAFEKTEPLKPTITALNEQGRILADEIARLKEKRQALAEEVAKLKKTDQKTLGEEIERPKQTEAEEMTKLNEAEPEEAPALVNPEDIKALEEAETVSPPVPEPEDHVYDVPIVFNEKVKAYIRLFQTSKWGGISRGFQRAGRYLPMVRDIFEEMGLPSDLVNLAFIESAFNPWARSKANAVGIWQFIASTGRRHGLKVNHWIDERRDPEKATRAAASYLKNLYELFNSWELVLAAYNAGELRVQQAVKRQKTMDFWALKLPQETTLFVPAFMAMTIIAKDPERYGFSPPVEEPIPFERVTIKGPINLKLVVKAANTSLELIRDLNPELSHWVTPPSRSAYELKLPRGNMEEFLLAIAQISKDQRAGSSLHLVKKGETLKKIAKSHRVSPSRLAKLNGLEQGGRLKIGSTLLLPFPTDSTSRISSPKLTSLPAPQSGAARQAGDGARPLKGEATHHHHVKKGESLWRIARSYDVSVEGLKRWNGLDGDDRLYPGRILFIDAPGAGKADHPKVPHRKPMATLRSEVLLPDKGR